MTPEQNKGVGEVKHKLKIYLKSGQAAEIITRAELSGEELGRSLLGSIPELKLYDYEEINLVTLEPVEE